MARYRLEFYGVADEEPCLLGRFATMREAELAFEREWDHWRFLAADPIFKRKVYRVNGAEFLVQSDSGQKIVYRVQAE